MALNDRAGLSAVDLTSLHVPLPKRERRQPVEEQGREEQGIDTSAPLPPASVPAPAVHVSTNVVELYPSLARGRKERLYPASFRIPISQIERLETLKKERGILPSDLVRDAISRVLADIDAAERTAANQ